jgi:lon-related putative ATP-dependent protease
MDLKKADQPQELTPDKLRWTCPADKIVFASTSDYEPCEEIIGQQRALRSLRTGLDIKTLGYNIFISGMVGTGRTTTIKQLLERLKTGEPIPDDILFVNNFKNPDEPRLIMLPAGKGKAFVESMAKLIDRLQQNVPELLKSKYYSARRNEIIESHQKKQQDILKTFEDEVAEKGFTVIQVQMGLFVKPDLIPLVEGQPTPFPKLEALVKEKKFPAKQLEDLKARYDELSDKLEKIFGTLRDIEEETRNQLQAWDAEAITPIIKDGVNGLRADFPYPQAQDYFAEVEENLIKNNELFKGTKKEEEGGGPERARDPNDPFLEYRVNLLVDNSEMPHAPVIIENNPSYVNLYGSIESAASRFGAWQTDFTRIKAGSFLKANGGYLIINALDAVIEPGVWPTLKRTLRSQVFEIQNFASLYFFSPKSLKPQPIKVNVKVVMIGDDEVYNILYFADSDFRKIFKIKAEFDSEITRTDRTIGDYASFIQKICKEEGLNPFDREGIAAIIEYGTRVAGRQRKVSARFNIVADVIRESSYWSVKDHKDTVTRRHVDRAVKERFERVSLIEDKIQEMIEEGSILIDTQGAVVGQVNGLSVYDMGQFAFGKPTRITAKTSVGRTGIINIEREADMSGPTHNKGVLILAGYLRGRYAQHRPLSMSASIAFEQSYGGVDGDSASSTEVYAILSSLSRLPLRQDLAVTGSLNQKGEIQPIGGVNEKIEGFFDVCKAKGLTGTQGVIIPQQNVQNLMLRHEVVDAVKAGKFHIHPVGSIDQGIEILTGVKAGERGEDGNFEEGTVHDRVDQELQRLAKTLKESAPAPEERGEHGSGPKGH